MNEDDIPVIYDEANETDKRSKFFFEGEEKVAFISQNMETVLIYANYDPKEDNLKAERIFISLEDFMKIDNFVPQQSTSQCRDS